MKFKDIKQLRKQIASTCLETIRYLIHLVSKDPEHHEVHKPS